VEHSEKWRQGAGHARTGRTGRGGAGSSMRGIRPCVRSAVALAHSCDKVKAEKGAYGGPDREGCNAYGGEVGVALSSRCLSDGASSAHKPSGGQ
jgi:hypothetical protein